jgi:cytochrome c peroxidase
MDRRKNMTHRRVMTGFACVWLAALALVTLTADSRAKTQQPKGWWQTRNRPVMMSRLQAAQAPMTATVGQPADSVAQPIRDLLEGERLFDRETFGGNGRTCLTCHSRETGTVSPADARARLRRNPDDPLFVHDGSDDEDGDGFGDGHHVSRMLQSATILMRIQLHPNAELKGHPEIREITVRRGIPTTLNTPALDPVLMLDGRQPTLQDQALGAITDHAQATKAVTPRQLDLIASFQKTPRFYSSFELLLFAVTGQHAPGLPPGRTASEKRGRVFFEDLPPDFSVSPPNFKPGACAACHSGPMLNQTNPFLPLPVLPGSRFQTVLVSEFNTAGNPVMDFVFRNQPNDLDPMTNQDGTPDGVIEVSSPDPGRALITGRADDFFPLTTATFDGFNAFKISSLRGIRHTAPYFHDNSATTLEDLVEHYRKFFLIVSDVDGPGPAEPLIILTEQDKRDIVAYLKLLD